MILVEYIKLNHNTKMIVKVELGWSAAGRVRETRNMAKRKQEIDEMENYVVTRL